MTEGLNAIATRVRAATRGPGRSVVAVDGIGASGKSTFAAGLAGRMLGRPVITIHLDDYFNAPEVRHARGRYSPEGFFLDTYDLRAIVDEVLEPLSTSGDGRFSSGTLDRVSGSPVRTTPLHADDDAIVLVEGAFLHRDELIGFWDFSVFLDVPFDAALQRMEHRNGIDAEHPLMSRYFGAQRLYFARVAPWERASVVVENSDVDAPVVIPPSTSAAARMRTEPPA